MLNHREVTSSYGNLLILGLGLLGGSAALVARKRGIAQRVSAWARPGKDHAAAKQAGVIDDWGTDLHTMLEEADFVLLCQPVDAICAILPEVMAHVREGTIVTDVGSTKGTLVHEAERHPSRGVFVGSHPMAGSHLVGWENARAELFDGATAYVTITEKTPLVPASRVVRFWSLLGSRVVVTHPNRHDHLAALLSHVPHMAAVGLVQHLGASHEDPNLMKFLAGNGFRDTTRIAMGSAQVWREICQHNSQHVSDELEALSVRIAHLAEVIREERFDELEALLTQVAALRQQFQH